MQICEDAGCEAPAGTFSQPINSPAVLAYWQVQVVVMSLLNPVQSDQIRTSCQGTSPEIVRAEVSSASVVALPRMGGASGMGRGLLTSRGNNPWLTPRAPDPDP